MITNYSGPAGPQGPAGTLFGFADFYAIMHPDNASTVAPGGDVSFPQDGPAYNSDISRTSFSSFNLAEIGTYLIMFQVSVLVTLNGSNLEYTVTCRATGTSQISNTIILTTTSENSILTIRNPAGNAIALTITPLAGGTRSVSAHLVILRIE